MFTSFLGSNDLIQHLDVVSSGKVEYLNPSKINFLNFVVNFTKVA